MEWYFLLKLIRYLGFYDHWINMIRKCISTPSFSILLNVIPNGNVDAPKGIKVKGILCLPSWAKVLSRLLKKVVQGFSLDRSNHKTSFLQFVESPLF